MPVNKRFGELLSEGISSVARRQGKKMSGVEDEIADITGYSVHTVQKWRHGNIPPNESTVAQLCEYCVKKGRVDHTWAESLLTQARYSDKRGLLAALFLDYLQSTRILILYKGDVVPDQKLAGYLRGYLATRNHEVFFSDISLREEVVSNRRLTSYLRKFLAIWGRKAFSGDASLRVLDQQIKASSHLIVLLSEDSANSEVIQELIRQAAEHHREQGWPYILPIFAAYKGPLPYPIASLLNDRQYVVWSNEADDERVGQAILAALDGNLPEREPIRNQPVSDSRPHPQYDARLLKVPVGAVEPNDPFYIERDVDSKLKRYLKQSGSTTIIRAPRQMGKSSLLAQGLYYARENGFRVVYLDMQTVDHDDLTSHERFLDFLMEFIIDELQLDPKKTEQVKRTYPSTWKSTELLEDYILPASDNPIVLAIDEVDRLVNTSYYLDFAGLVRSWHNIRASGKSEQWKKLHIVLVVSTVSYLLTPDRSVSPLNVGGVLALGDFNEAQVRDLNRRHDSPIKESDLPQLMDLLNGHPFLTRMALYTLVTRELTWPGLIRNAVTDSGPFGDHLRYHYWLLHDKEHLKTALKQIIREDRCEDQNAFFCLQQAGLVEEEGNKYICRCGLYRSYFKSKLG